MICNLILFMVQQSFGLGIFFLFGGGGLWFVVGFFGFFFFTSHQALPFLPVFAL